ncbi:MAG TPA: hypothetical protein VN181_16545, partial [Thermoanaerobaculia bacterium]|nr:hypothetical protein [Thermoanaerobaculia bacterium]
MRLLKILVSAAVIAASLYAIHRWCWLPYRCDEIEKAALLVTSRTLQAGAGYDESVRARQTATRV